MAETIPEFFIAVEQLREFLSTLGHPPGEFVWIFREDASTFRRRVSIKVPLPATNEQVARGPYERGRELGFGVCLDVFCRLGSAYCCTCWYVRSWQESVERLCRGLKLRVGSDLPDAIPVRSRLVWSYRCWADGRSDFHHFGGFLPSRDDEDKGDVTSAP